MYIFLMSVNVNTFCNNISFDCDSIDIGMHKGKQTKCYLNCQAIE